MNKEIQEFQESFFFGLSMRQCFFSVLAIAAAVGVYLGTKDTCGTEIAGWLSVFAAAPFAGCGFFRYHQMTLEKFVWVWLKSEILCPKKLVFQSENLYLKCLEEIQEKQKEVLEHYDITRFIQLDREFHTYIYQMSQNRELLKLLSNYYDMFRFMGMQAVRGTDKRRQTTIDEHQGILDALKQKNVEAAVRAMKIHMEETEKNINQNHAMKQNVR